MIPMEGLQETNPEVKLTDNLALEWAQDCVTTEEVEEFSQKWLGENIVDVDILSAEEVIKRFDRDNPELKTEWDKERKLKFINSWKVKPRG